jgi:1,2-phenylacetyl-CoA epoxidase PaaB subunit
MWKAAETEPASRLRVYDIFGSASRKSAQIAYLGSLEAPNPALGRIYAAKIFARRAECRRLWIYERNQLEQASTGELVFDFSRSEAPHE